tara:strand:+ start:1305 stop:1526 length:222 start_codon:yes stop_codon:yes gene_type:complete
MADLNTAYNTLLESQQIELEELKEFYKQKCEEYNELKRAYEAAYEDNYILKQMNEQLTDGLTAISFAKDELQS